MDMMRLMKSTQVLRLIAFFVLVVAFKFIFPHQYRLDLTVGGDFPRTSHAEFYSSSAGPQFDPITLVRTFRVERPDGVQILAQMSTDRATRFIRFDPVVGELPFQIEWFEIRSDAGNVRYTARELQKVALQIDQIEVRASPSGLLNFVATGPDSKFILPIERSIAKGAIASLARYWASLVVASASVVLLAWLLRAWIARPPAWFLRIQSRFERFGTLLSDEASIMFPAGAVWVYAVLLAAFVVWVGLKLHQSSIGVWDNMYATEIHHSEIEIGAPRGIRSDEWNTFTPWMLSQVQNGMEIDNPNLGARASAILTGAPVGGPLLLAQPKYWGFAIFDLEHGFSWFWAFKVFGLIGAFFTLLLLLTKGEVVVSLGGALAVYGSSLVQWWFSGIAPELIMGFSISVVGSIYLLQAQRVGGMAFGALLLALVIPNLLMHIYPPHLLPLAYLACFTVAGLLLQKSSLARLTFRWKSRLMFGLLTSAALAFMVAYWWIESIDAIHLMMNTVYPGKRFILGGDMDFSVVFHGIFESWRIDDWPLPYPGSNQTASSQMWVLFPMVWFLVDWRQWFQPGFRVFAALMAYCFLVVVWTSVPIPSGLRDMMAHAGWSLSPPWNSLIGLGVVSMMLMPMLVAGVAEGAVVKIKWRSGAVAAVVAGIVFVYGLYLQTFETAFFTVGRIALASVFMGAMAWTVHQGQRWGFFWLCVLSTIPGLMVNPVRNDLDAYLNKSLFVQAKAVGGQAGDRWAVFGNTDIAQGFKAAGLTVINGSNYAPRMQLLSVLDPDYANQKIWNRYAHVGFTSGSPGGEPKFKLIFADQYDVALDVCGRELSKLGVKYVAYTYAPSAAELRCLMPLPLPVSDGQVRLYALKANVEVKN